MEWGHVLSKGAVSASLHLVRFTPDG